MSVLPGATNTTINNGHFTAVSTTVANTGAQNDIVTLLHVHSATAGLLDAKERFDAPECDEDTRTSMILEMKKFVQDGDASSSPALYWLHGPAGVGKSALAQSLSLSLKSEGDHAASFFFSRTSPGRDNGNQLIVSLAYQLAINFPALQRFISKVVTKNPAILSASNTVQMQGLIIDPINKWQKRYKWSVRRLVRIIFSTNEKLYPRLVLVDGLDECNDPNVQRDLILCIGLTVRRLAIPLRFVISSRPESHILATFELNPAFQDISGVNITRKNLGDDEDADAHITTYLLKEFAEIRRAHPIREYLPEQWPRPDQIEQLVSKSSKGFIYPATVIRYIKMPHNRPDKCLERILGLSEIPTADKPYEPLDCLYRHIFESVPEVNKPSVHDIFHFLVLPSIGDGVITPQMIERHFDYMPGHVQHVLRDLLCLVALTHDHGPIKVLHASLPDFLLDQSRSGSLYIAVDDAHATLAASYLLDILHNDTLPSLEFVGFLKHMKHANASFTLLRRRILEVDLVSRYKKLWQTRISDAPCSHVDSQFPPNTQFLRFRSRSVIGCHTTWNSHYTPDSGTSVTIALLDSEIAGIALMIAYLLVLMIKDVSREYIMDQIANAKAYVFQIYPFADSVYVVHSKLVPAMVPLFGDWRSKIYDEYIRNIFVFEVSPLQYEMREAIFELYFLVMATFCSITTSSRREFRDYMEPRMEEHSVGSTDKEVMTFNYWAGIVRGVFPPSTELTPGRPSFASSDSPGSTSEGEMESHELDRQGCRLLSGGKQDGWERNAIEKASGAAYAGISRTLLNRLHGKP